jgi:cytochrome c
MLKQTLTAVALFATFASSAFAGDPAAGEKDFKRCKACHSIIAPDGTAVQKGGKTGPNLYGVIGRALASEDFKYSPSMVAAAAIVPVWDEAHVVAYVTDPTAWLKETLGDDSAKAAMTFKLKSGAEDMAAYLATFN